MRSVWIAGLPLSSPPLTTTVETATGPDDGGDEWAWGGGLGVEALA